MKRLPTHVRFKILCAIALLTIGIVMSIKNGSFIPILLSIGAIFFFEPYGVKRCPIRRQFDLRIREWPTSSMSK